MEHYTVDGIEVSLEALAAPGGDGTQVLRVCNCEWRAEVEMLPRCYGELGYSVELTLLACSGNRRKFQRDFARLEPLFARLVPNPRACLVISHPMLMQALKESA